MRSIASILVGLALLVGAGPACAVNGFEDGYLRRANKTFSFVPPDTGGGNVNAKAWDFTLPTTHYSGLGTWALLNWDAQFNTVYDPTIATGYNVAFGGGRSTSTEPYLATTLETNYKYNSGLPATVEWYLEYQPNNSATGTPAKRPIFFQWERASGVQVDGSFRSNSFSFYRWDDPAECTGSGTPWACCTGAGAGATCGSVYASLSPTIFSLTGAVGQSTDTSFTATAQNSKNAYMQFNAGSSSILVGEQNSGGALIQTGGSNKSLSIDAAAGLVFTTGQINNTAAAPASADWYTYQDQHTSANTNNGSLHVSFYARPTMSGGTQPATIEGLRFQPTDASSPANTHRGYRCYLGSVTGASTVSQCLQLDAQTGVGGTHSLGTMANGKLSMTSAPFEWNTNPAQSGDLRVPNNEDGLCWRNAANSADLCLKADASNNLLFNGAGFSGSGDITDVGDCATGACFTSGGASGSLLVFHGTGDPADSGVIRLGNNEAVCWEQNPTGTDQCAKLGTDNIFALPSVSATALAAITGTGTISSNNSTVTGSGTSFTTQLVKGSTIIASGQRQIVTKVTSNTSLTIANRFNSNLSAGTSFTFVPPVARMFDDSGNAAAVFTADGGFALGVDAVATWDTQFSDVLIQNRAPESTTAVSGTNAGTVTIQGATGGASSNVSGNGGGGGTVAVIGGTGGAGTNAQGAGGLVQIYGGDGGSGGSSAGVQILGAGGSTVGPIEMRGTNGGNVTISGAAVRFQDTGAGDVWIGGTVGSQAKLRFYEDPANGGDNFRAIRSAANDSGVDKTYILPAGGTDGDEIIVATTMVKPVFAVNSTRKIAAGQTFYMQPNGNADTVENSGGIPMPAGTFKNLRCNADTAPGGSDTIALTGGVGTCGSTLTYTGTFTCTISASGTTCSDTSTTTTTTAGQCMTVRAVSSATAATAGVACTFERIT